MPILREFDLDIPYVSDEKAIQNIMDELNFEYFEATRYDYEKTWKLKRMRFRDEIRCVASLYTRFFEKYKTEDCWKIMPNCVEYISRMIPVSVGGVYEVDIKLDIDSFLKLDDYNKKKQTLELLMNGIDKVLETTGWDRTPFDDAYKKVKDCDYENIWMWKKPLKSPRKDYIAQVICEHNVTSFKIFILIKTRIGEEIEKSLIKTEKPNEFDYTKHFGELKWISDKEVVLVNKDGTEQWGVRL
ncbi:hypothetical protein R2R35_13965 [Anaerocolumna sp. AGMB13020]|uniref:hypothetical protein n=1 Tax=Anaerocolumna sp. AGMB13020 TaxID=3081750 RepID=UPI002952C3FB|nr:hypothetical protein [Anaerocolumna sp. AGMB13020]WOO34904.1 hypothetical protein R2R35_13965 [Anaerocolumna sp. AGMB13020]